MGGFFWHILYLFSYYMQDPSFFFLSQRRFNIESRALQRTLAALSQAISQSEGLQYHESNNELLSLYQVSVLCNQAKLLCPDCGNSYWEQLKIHILKTNEELARVGEYLFDQSAFSVNTAIAGELDILCSLSRSMVHLGVVLSQLLLPSSVDPVHVASIYYQCHYHMVWNMCVSSHYLCVCRCVYASVCILMYIEDKNIILISLMCILMMLLQVGSSVIGIQ